MRTLHITDLREDLDQLAEDAVAVDYVYAYPPRQAYRSLPADQLDRAVARSLSRQGPTNLYVHVPFCRQICSFCNLYAVVGTEAPLFERYVECLLQEAASYRPWLAGKDIQTLYIGGGTPSQLPAKDLERLVGGLEELYGFDRAGVEEVALEVAPDTVTPERLLDYRRAGINRINLGMQTGDDQEMRLIGRQHDAQRARLAVTHALQAGFENVCVDLIYGLRGQTHDKWRLSIDGVVALEPPTVCAYPLTLRPRTGYAARRYTTVDPSEQYEKYDYADAALKRAGYRQETHVRWTRCERGGYRQKSNHWAMADVVGLGAGARGYLWECDYRNGYSARHRMPVLRDWMVRVERHGHGRVDGFLMDKQERINKSLILGLQYLDRRAARELLGVDPVVGYERELSAMAEHGLVEFDGQHVALTAAGMRKRDVLVQAFFSDQVLARITDFDYDDD